MKQKYIVSRNYIDRNSANKWLIRRAGEAPEKAIPVRSVHLDNFEFKQSDDYEQGFGCNIVAVGELSERTTESPEATELKFDGRYTFHINGVQTPACEVGNGSALTLRPDGTILAVR